MGPLELGARGRRGEPHDAAQAAVSTAAHRRVCVIAGLRPRGSERRTAVRAVLSERSAVLAALQGAAIN